MADKSWGVSGTAPVVRDRGKGQGDTLLSRIDARSAARAVAAEAREQERAARLAERAERAAKDPHAADAQRPRGSGRKDIVREQRDTTGYAVVVDEGRIRSLAERGASVTGLARVFGLTTDKIERVLNTGE